jgi:TPR repeat protein
MKKSKSGVIQKKTLPTSASTAKPVLAPTQQGVPEPTHAPEITSIPEPTSAPEPTLPPEPTTAPEPVTAPTFPAEPPVVPKGILDLETRATEGDVDAMCALGNYYASEETLNYLASTKWLRLASKSGNPVAMLKLGHVLITQYGDYKEAIQWLHLAVDEHQSMEAMLALGDVYRTNASGVMEVEKSELWFTKASKLGSVDAMFQIGMLCSEQDPRRKGMNTIKWFKRAAKKGHAASMYQLGVYFGRSDTLIKDLEKSCHWYLHAANAGYLDALVPLGLLYMLPNNGLPTNYIVAYALFTLASIAQEEEYKRKQAHQQADILKQHMQQKEIDSALSLSQKIAAPGTLLSALNSHLSSPARKK